MGSVVALVDHDDDRGVPAPVADRLQPGEDGVVVFSARLNNDEVQAPLREKEAVGAVHDLLAAEVPDVELDRAVRFPPGSGLQPVADGGARGLGLARVTGLPCGEEAY